MKTNDSLYNPSGFLLIGFVIFVFWIGYPNQMQGQKMSQIRFSTITNENGLPNNEVMDIIKDNQGFLWIATNDGLCRYETATQQAVFTVDKSNYPEGLRSNTIRTLYIDRHDHLWIGTTLGGLTRYHQPTNTWKTYLHDPDDPSSISNNEILSIIEDQSGKIWVGTEYGLNVFDPESETFFSFLPDPSGTAGIKTKAVVKIYEDQRGYIWLGTWAGGLYLVLSGKTDKPEDIRFRNINISDNTATHNVWTMFQDRKNQFWIGTHGGGLFLMDLPNNYSNRITQQDWIPDFYPFVHQEGVDQSLSNDGVQAINQDKKGNLWVGTVDGLNLIPVEDIPAIDDLKAGLGTTSFQRINDDSANPVGLPSDNISTIYKDKQDMMWLGTSGGICQFDNFNNQFNAIDARQLNSEHPNYGNLYVDTKDYLWVANSENGLVKYDLTEQKIAKTFQKELGHPFVMAIYSHDDVALTVGTKGGVTLLNMQTSSTTYFPFPNWIIQNYPQFAVTSVFQDQKKQVWITSLNGLYILNIEDGSYTAYQHDPADPTTLIDSAVTGVFEDSRGTVWVSTYNGLSRVVGEDYRTLQFQNFKANPDHPDTGPVSNRVMSINEIGGILYLGTFSGLSGYDLNKKKFINISENQPKFRVNAITDGGNGSIWLSSTDGLVRYEPKTSVFNKFLKKDGLQDIYFGTGSSCVDSNGNLYFGNQNGITWFHPSKILKNETIPPVYVTEVKTMSASKSEKVNTIFKNKITLDHDVYYLSLSFAGLNYNNSDKNKFAYKLKGFEENWTYTDHANPVVYTNLTPGDYHFQVRAANNDGVWNEVGATLDITVLYAFWETWWFKIGTLLVFTLLTFSGFNFYTRTVRNRNLELKQFNDNLNREISERKKVELALHEREHQMEQLVDKRTKELQIKSELLVVKNKEVEQLLTRIKSRNEELEVIVAKRTQNLKEANLDLIRSNRDLEQFAYMASHDLQEPIRTISNFLGLVKKKYRELLPDSARQYIDFADDGAKRMSILISSLLTYSQVGQKGMEFKHASLKEMLEYKLLDLGQRIEERNAIVTLKELPVIFCERNQLAMVFYNLINNAIKFNKSEPPTIEIGVSDDGPEGYWTIYIRDNGIGIQEADQQRIFEVFSRLHSRANYEGTGIGLALCKKVINSHGGDIWLESKENEGTTFYVSIDKNLGSKLDNEKAGFNEKETGESWGKVLSN